MNDSVETAIGKNGHNELTITGLNLNFARKSFFLNYIFFFFILVSRNLICSRVSKPDIILSRVLVIIIIHYDIAIIVLLGNLKTYCTQNTIERIISEARSFIHNAYGKLTNRVKVFSVPELWTTCIRIAIFQNGKFKMFSCL